MELKQMWRDETYQKWERKTESDEDKRMNAAKARTGKQLEEAFQRKT